MIDLCPQWHPKMQRNEIFLTNLSVSDPNFIKLSMEKLLTNTVSLFGKQWRTARYVRPAYNMDQTEQSATSVAILVTQEEARQNGIHIQ